ncbi:MAG: nicotinate-nucleotide adenylyltransferase [Candidatus Ancillula trichonymphae]|jgi:nicotinate-nucleotide adenylyltransferase|nr:nicotinate-nucleotide adenylyltransferase [Candidatus Ancillula trichonymphae]
MLIGVLGGTFDPVHNGHFAVVHQVFDKLNLDRLLLVPTYTSTSKNSETVLPPEQRLKMLHMALQDYSRTNSKTACVDKIQVSQVDINRKKPTYTHDTLMDLHKKYKGAEFYFLLGDDIADDVPNWKNADELPELAKFVVVSRQNARSSKFQTEILQIDSLPISSKIIRQKVANGLPIDDLVSESVAKYIKEMNFWKNN